MKTRVNKVSKKRLKVIVCKCGHNNLPVRTMYEFIRCGGCRRTLRAVPYFRPNPRHGGTL